MANVRIEQWAVAYDDPTDIYTAPEIRPRHLVGKVYGHPSFPDGEEIGTGTLLSSSGRMASTRKTTYVLGEPNPDYVVFLVENSLPAIDPEQPIKIRAGTVQCPNCGSTQCSDSNFCDQCSEPLKVAH